MTEKIEEIQRIIGDHEKRITELEKAITAEKPKPKYERGFKGLSGGIEYLVSRGFLNAPKLAKEIQEELAKEGYHYGYACVDKLLRIDFMTKKKTLTRIKEKKCLEVRGKEMAQFP